MTSPQDTLHNESRLKTVLIAGVGNIGSGLAPMLARAGGVARVFLVDPDAYEAKNLACQDISPRDVGRPKALVQARRLRRINPALDARPLRARVEDLPLGVLRVDAILSCVDSRALRRYINQAAWRLGVPWIDGAVDATGLLARVNAYVPGPAPPCMECSWDDDDYRSASLEQPYACQQAAGVAATNAPASLGLVTAGMMAIECQKLLAGEFETLLAGRQVMLDLRHHTHFVTSFRRGHCRFDHETWQVERCGASPAELTLSQAIRLGGDGSESAGDLATASGWALRVEGRRFATLLCCPACGHRERVALHVAGRFPHDARRCASCGQAMVVRGFDMLEWIDSQSIGDADLSRPLSAFGVESSDVISVRSPAGVRHFVLAAAGAGADGGIETRSTGKKTRSVSELSSSPVAAPACGYTSGLNDSQGDAP